MGIGFTSRSVGLTARAIRYTTKNEPKSNKLIIARTSTVVDFVLLKFFAIKNWF